MLREVKSACQELTVLSNNYSLLYSHASFDGTSSAYPTNMLACWVIRAPENKVIRAYSQLFDVSESSNCRADHLNVFCGDTTEYTSVGTFCGGNPLEIAYSSGTSLYLEFVTDDIKEDHKGFKISYGAIDRDLHTPSCETDMAANSLMLLIFSELLLIVATTLMLIVLSTCTYLIYKRVHKSRKATSTSTQKWSEESDICERASLTTNASAMFYQTANLPVEDTHSSQQNRMQTSNQASDHNRVQIKVDHVDEPGYCQHKHMTQTAPKTTVRTTGNYKPSAESARSKLKPAYPDTGKRLGVNGDHEKAWVGRNVPLKRYSSKEEQLLYSCLSSV